ncbi:MAG: outer membrane lipoprotein carrier protein LolA [Sphingomonadales bacterium]|nr:outer membrane lipoprotein carrier protein LolA [Sphingomonadales bacterium]
MNKYLTAIIAAPFALVASTAAPAQQASNKMDAVVQHMKSVSSMTANFTQTDGSGRSVSGKLLLKRPGHVRFEYTGDTSLLIVADGKALTMIDYAVRQVQRWPIKNSPLTALLDPGQDLRKYGKLQPTSNDKVISVEVRDPGRPEYGTMTFTFTKDASAPSGYTLYGWVALDSKNNRTTVRLGNIKYNVAISDKSFNWTDPRRRGRK